MKTFHKLAILAVAAVAIAAGPQGSDPNALLKQIQEFRTQKLTELRNSGQPLTAASVNAITKEAVEKAKAAVKGVDPAKIDAKQGLAWARLFSMAEMHQQACDAAKRYLESNPEPPQKYAAQTLMMQSCNALGEGHMLVMMIGEVVPPTSLDSLSLATMTAYEYADTIKNSMSADEAVKAIEKVESMLPSRDSLDDKTQPRLSQAIAQLAQTKSEILAESGKSDEALAAIDKALAMLPEGDANARSLKAGKTRMVLLNKPAPALTAERSYGEFNGLESLKGKVVILDFFAHWCGPCIASFNDMKKLYADLKDKGLEFVHVTTYYGYYKGENREKRDMPRDTEFGKMKEFIDEYQLPWPVVYGERANFDAYGITGIPHVVVLDREGKVHKIKIGYSAQSFAKFREEVEQLVAGK